MKLFSIGDMARMFHVSVSSLRHYEKEGLLQPERVDPQTGYRYYSVRQFEVMNTLRYLRALDMPLPEIADFLRNRDVGRMEEKLRQQREIVMQKQRELQRIERKIENRLSRLQEAQTGPMDTVQLVQAPACRLALVESPLEIHGFLDMETPIRGLEVAEGEAVVFLGKVGLGISPEHLAAQELGQYDMIFLMLDEEDHYAGQTLMLPPVSCLRVRFCGSHSEAPARYALLLREIEARGLRIAGFSREITLIDYGLTNDLQKFVTEISIPVRKPEPDA